jgi:hypothetical protein
MLRANVSRQPLPVAHPERGYDHQRVGRPFDHGDGALRDLVGDRAELLLRSNNPLQRKQRRSYA